MAQPAASSGNGSTLSPESRSAPSSRSTPTRRMTNSVPSSPWTAREISSRPGRRVPTRRATSTSTRNASTPPETPSGRSSRSTRTPRASRASRRSPRPGWPIRRGVGEPGTGRLELWPVRPAFLELGLEARIRVPGQHLHVPRPVLRKGRHGFGGQFRRRVDGLRRRGRRRRGVFGQRFDASGTKIGSEFQVNTTTTDYQGDYGGPAIAMTPSGSFVVVWSSGPDWIPSGHSRAAIREQRNEDRARIRRRPSSGLGQDGGVATDPSGNFMVVWQDAGWFRSVEHHRRSASTGRGRRSAPSSRSTSPPRPTTTPRPRSRWTVAAASRSRGP